MDEASTPGLIAFAAAAFFVAGGVKGVMGLGLPLVAVAILSTALDIRVAVPLVVFPVLALNLWQGLAGSATARVLRRYAVVILSITVGIVVGTELLFVLDPRIMVAVLGFLVCAYVAFNLLALDFRLHPRFEPLVGPPVGFVGGVFCGAAASLGPTIVAYLQALRISKEEFIQATGLIFFVASIPWIAMLLYKGALPLATAGVSAGAVVPAALGMAGGTWLRRRISEERFRLVIFGALFVVGLNLIRRGIF